MQKRWFIVVLLFFSPFLVKAQDCEGCNATDEGEKADFCFKNEALPGQCAQFVSDRTFFFLNLKKDVVRVPLPADDKTDRLSYLVEIAQNKKFRKLTGADIAFIDAALEVWNVKKRTLGFEFDENGLGIKILQKGDGPLPQKGQKVVVHYTGWLEDGTKFDSSVDRGQPFEFPLGQGRVIKGWDLGVAKLNIGTKAQLYIPSELGYGDRGAGGGQIPGGATLIFEVELLEVKDK